MQALIEIESYVISVLVYTSDKQWRIKNVCVVAYKNSFHWFEKCAFPVFTAEVFKKSVKDLKHSIRDIVSSWLPFL